MTRILIVDDEQVQRDSLAGFLAKIGYEVHTEDSAQTALAYLYSNPIDIILSDYKMPYMTGLDLLQEVKTRHPNIVLVLITAYGTVEKAVEAMKAGAWDFLSKPVNLDQLEDLLKGIVKHLKERNTAETPRKIEEGIQADDFIAEDPSMMRLLEQTKRVAGSHATILITGETGVGKEVLADYIHKNSARSNKPMIAVNCAALPSHLIESELFGHEKGSFTGATASRIGRFEEASGGTLFLDEIGDLPLDMQTKLLRFLQSGEFQKIGENRVRKSDVRVLAATNVDIQHAIKLGEFREDLYYRLNVIQLHIPPLRERPQDVKRLAKYFVHNCSQREGRKNLVLGDQAVSSMLSYAFPGNVRELRNMMERAVLLSAGPEITSEDLNLHNQAQPTVIGGKLKDSVARLEGELINKTLDDSQGNQSECARRLGISERVLRYKLQKYSIK